MTQQVLSPEQTDGGLLLIVDDDERLREAVANELEKRGFRTVERACGREALHYLQSGERPDLIILDLVMPDMDGWEFRVEQLSSEALADIPVVALSGDVSAKARAFHAEAFLPKPTTTQLLLQTVEQVLMKAQRAPVVPELSDVQELSELGKFVDDAIRPMRIANTINEMSLDAATKQLAADDFSRASVKGWLKRARDANRIVSKLLLRAELFAHRNFSAAAAAKARVLIIDDRAANREHIAAMLRDTFTAHSARSASDALTQLTAACDYDLVICRLCMPTMSGADLLLSLARTHPEQAKRMLFIAGDSARERAEEQRLSDCHYVGVLRGALILEELRALVDATLEEQH